MSETRIPSSVVFREVAEELIARFVYVTDREQYGLGEHWTPCRELESGHLAGDCEDFAITIAEGCDKRGVPAEDLTLYMVAIEAGPDHIVIGCRDGDQVLIADCNSKRLTRRDERHYFRWVTERNLGGSEWRRSSAARG